MIKSVNHNLYPWTQAHVHYDMYEHDIYANKDKTKNDECKWRNEMLNSSPHGKLFIQNSFFNALKKSNKIYLMHVTPNFHNISKDNLIFPSSGCLVASIYCTPVITEGDKFRVNNMGEYILDKEMPMFFKFLESNSKSLLKTLLIEVELPDKGKGNLVGTDYLRLGDIHYQSFKDLEYLLSTDEKLQIQQSCISRIRKSLKYLCTCNRVFFSQEKFDLSNFLEIFCESIEYLPILGYFYSEVLSEYIMLFQDNEKASFYDNLGEFYTPTYKDMVYSLCSYLPKHFSLTQFKPTMKEVTDYLKNKNIFINFDETHFQNYLVNRLIFLTNARLLNSEIGLIDWDEILWDFDELTQYVRPLLGHLIHRELRTFGRYPHFYYYFDQMKALQIWNYWNQLNLVIPFNGIIPKGEVGINPAYPELKYKIYLAESYKEENKMYLKPTKEQTVQIVPRLVDPKFTAMGENKKEVRRN